MIIKNFQLVLFNKLYIGINKKDPRIYHIVVLKFNSKFNIDSLNLSIFLLLVNENILENL